MADFAALGSAHAARFTRAVRREVVLVHVALGFLRVDGVEALGFVEQTQGANGKRLGLAALEQARTMHARQVAGTNVERTNLVGGAAVGTLARLDDHAAHGMLLESLAGGGDIAAPCGALFLGEVVFLDGRLQGLNLGDARKLVGIVQGCAHLVVVGVDALGDGGVGHMHRIFLGLGSDLGQEFRLLLAEGGDGLLAELHGGEHVFLRNFLSAGFDHRDVVFGASDGELEVARLLLGVGGVHDELAGLGVAGNAHAGGRAVERGAAAQKRGRGAAHANAVGRVLAVARKRGSHDVDFLLEAVGEAGANGTVNHAGGKGALVGRLGLALEVAARNATDGVHLLDEVDGQREEVVVLLLLGDNGGDQARGFALRDEHGAGGLLGELAGFQAVALAVQLEALDDLFHVESSSFSSSSEACSSCPSRASGAPALPDRYILQKPAEAGSMQDLDVVANAELLDESAVVINVAILDVLEQTTTLTDELHEATTGVVVLLVLLEVLGEVLNAVRHDGDLNLGGTGIAFAFAVLSDEGLDGLFVNGTSGCSHCSTFLDTRTCHRAAVASRLLSFAQCRESMQVVRGNKALGNCNRCSISDKPRTSREFHKLRNPKPYRTPPRLRNARHV